MYFQVLLKLSVSCLLFFLIYNLLLHVNMHENTTRLQWQELWRHHREFCWGGMACHSYSSLHPPHPGTFKVKYSNHN
jgi:hypothetical protein